MLKKYAFTLGEVLVTLAIVGIVAAMTIPGVIKKVHEKSNIALLQKTLNELQTNIYADATEKGRDYKRLDIYKDPETFLKRLDISKFSTSAKPIWYPSDGYKTMNGDAQTTFANTNFDASAVLKTGVGVGIYTKNTGHVIISIDVNGEDEPNTIGVDAFEFFVYENNDTANNILKGDIVGGRLGDKTIAEAKAACKDGNVALCSHLVELSGYQAKYLEMKE